MDPKLLKYGVVIDSGSSGSRLQIYQWEDLHELQHHSKDESVLNSVPNLIQQEEWNFKITPGISSFEDKPERIWEEHFKSIVEFLEEIIPKDQQPETPFFVLATAGMRLVPEEKRFKILNNICSAVNSNSLFVIPDCQNYVQVIDGETEGLYGWIALNYLTGEFESQNSNHESYGFMDMGGASTQIAFVPSDKLESERHKDDLYTVTLRTVNGVNQNWDVFVSTWLGFGANQARKRHFKNALLSLPDSLLSKDEIELHLVDPCSPKGAIMKFNYKGEQYKIQGLGNYEYCLKEIYPLLLKHLPCKDEPCLFNGVHAPLIDFEKDKFVGISEYWYTANDVFDMGGEYSFLKFNEKVKEFCNDDWDSIMKNFNEGKYGKNMNLEYLKDSCFKASWVINVLHEGFGLPRIGLETDYLDEDQVKSINTDRTHIPFRSANLIKGSELSWTLGKMLLYVSSTIESEEHGVKVGIKPGENSVKLQGKQFVPGNIFEDLEVVFTNTLTSNPYPTGQSINGGSHNSVLGMFWFFVIGFLLLTSAFNYLHLGKYVNTKTLNLVLKSQFVQKVKLNVKAFYYRLIASQETIDIRDSNLALRGLEEGLGGEDPIFANKNGQGLRTRSSIVNFSNMHSSTTNNNLRPPLPVTASTSSVGSLLDFQNNFRTLNYKKSNEVLPNSSRNNSALDFNKLRSSITNSGAAGGEGRRVSNSAKLQID